MKTKLIIPTLALGMFLIGSSAFASTLPAGPDAQSRFERFQTVSAHLETAFGRIQTLIGKLQAHGQDTSALEAKIATAKTEHDAAVASFAKLKADYASAGNQVNATVRADAKQAKTDWMAFKQDLMDIHAQVKTIVATIKNAQGNANGGSQQ